MLRLSLVLLCGLFLPSACFGQVDTSSAGADREPSLCDLKHNPASYNGQWITVRGRISMEFEDFSLYDPDCNAPDLPGVWLTFGGDQNEFAVYCCPSGTRKKGVDIEVEGHRVSLVRDRALSEFQRVLQVGRLRRPDGSRCEGIECNLYRPVNATITGMFLAGQDSAESPGYGHLGCCHLLVIKQVSDVSAERTQVPAGGEFKCSRETWNVSPADAVGLENLMACSGSLDEDCDHDRRIAVTRIATHWNDKVDVDSGHHQRDVDLVGDSTDRWISADLLTTYSTAAKKASAKLLVTRQVCVPVSNRTPNVLSNPVSCREYTVSWRDDEHSAQRVDELMDKNQFDQANAKIAEASKEILGEGDQSWRLGDPKSAARHALQEQTGKWGVVPEAKLHLENCNDASLPEQRDHLVGCNWYSDDGTQVFWVALQKPKSKKANPAVGRALPWIITSVNATVCH